MMEKKPDFRHSCSAHIRAAKLLHQVNPGYFGIITLHCIVAALTPYVTVFFSAQVLKELALLRRPEVLWTWALSGVLCTGLFAVLKAFLFQRSETLRDDIFNRKEILYAKKMFSLDYADMDKQETHDLRQQIRQTEGWAHWGLSRVPEVYEYGLKSVVGIFSGIALTVSLFTTPVPADAGNLTVLNNPIFCLALMAIMVLVSLLAGLFNVKAISCWSSVADEATFGNRLFGFFGFLGTKKGRGTDIRMYNQQYLVRAYWTKNKAFGVEGAIAKQARGAMGIYGGLGTGITVLITGSVYVFTCRRRMPRPKPSGR